MYFIYRVPAILASTPITIFIYNVNSLYWQLYLQYPEHSNRDFVTTPRVNYTCNHVRTFHHSPQRKTNTTNRIVSQTTILPGSLMESMILNRGDESYHTNQPATHGRRSRAQFSRTDNCNGYTPRSKRNDGLQLPRSRREKCTTILIQSHRGFSR